MSRSRRFAHVYVYSVELDVGNGRIVSKQIGIVHNDTDWGAMKWRYKMYRYWLGESKVKLRKDVISE